MCIISCSELIRGYYTGRKITATHLAEKFDLNIRTLNPSLNKMTHAGILKSQVGGVDRGYIFTRDPKNITVYDVVNAVEGFAYMKNCKNALQGATCSISDCSNCIMFSAAAKIVDFTKEEYKKITIYDLFFNQNNIGDLQSLRHFTSKSKVPTA